MGRFLCNWSVPDLEEFNGHRSANLSDGLPADAAAASVTHVELSPRRGFAHGYSSNSATNTAACYGVLRFNRRIMAKAIPPAQILLIDDDPGAIQLLGGVLTPLGALRFATNGRDGLRLAHEFIPDLILLDAEMPGMSGFDLLRALKEDLDLADVPVIFITGHTEAGFEVSALEMGAADFIAKPFRSSLVVARVKIHLRLKRMADELRQAATTDVLTGLANRRRFDAVLEREWSRARRGVTATSLLLIEVDHFKQFKDRYGHQNADDCIALVAQALLTVCHRPADLVARCGGADFLMLLPETERLGAEHIARRAADAILALSIAHADAPAHRCITASIGVACHDAHSSCAAGDHTACSSKSLVSAADGALYTVKRSQRPPVTAAAEYA